MWLYTPAIPAFKRLEQADTHTHEGGWGEGEGGGGVRRGREGEGVAGRDPVLLPTHSFIKFLFINIAMETDVGLFHLLFVHWTQVNFLTIQ